MTIDWLSRATGKAGYGDAQQVKVLVEPDDGVTTLKPVWWGEGASSSATTKTTYNNSVRIIFLKEGGGAVWSLGRRGLLCSYVSVND